MMDITEKQILREIGYNLQQQGYTIGDLFTCWFDGLFDEIIEKFKKQ